MLTTGGGSFVKPSVDETGQKLIAALRPQFFPLANPYDDDVDFHLDVINGKLYFGYKTPGLIVFFHIS